MGSPAQFADLASMVYDNGCSYISLLLPGHGASAQEFIRSSADDWQRHVQNVISEIRDKYAKIYLVGHSMGGLLALNASLLRGNKIAGVFLIATPLQINLFHFQSLTCRLRLLIYPKEHPIKSMYLQSYSIDPSNICLYPLFLKPCISFYGLIGKTKKHLAEVLVPVYMFFSANDEAVSYKSAALFSTGLRNAQRTVFSISKSWHAFYYADERKIISEKLLDFINL